MPAGELVELDGLFFELSPELSVLRAEIRALREAPRPERAELIALRAEIRALREAPRPGPADGELAELRDEVRALRDALRASQTPLQQKMSNLQGSVLGLADSFEFMKNFLGTLLRHLTLEGLIPAPRLDRGEEAEEGGAGEGGAPAARHPAAPPRPAGPTKAAPRQAPRQAPPRGAPPGGLAVGAAAPGPRDPPGGWTLPPGQLLAFAGPLEGAVDPTAGAGAGAPARG